MRIMSGTHGAPIFPLTVPYTLRILQFGNVDFSTRPQPK